MASSTPPSSTGAPSSAGEPRYLVLLAITILGTLAGGLVTALAIGALLSFLPSAVGVGIGIVVGFGLPLFLALRANAALRRRRRGLLLRRLAMLALIGAAQLAITGAILQYSSRNTGHLAYAAFETLDAVGGVPVASDLLYAHAERMNALPGTGLTKGHPHPKVGPDGGVLLEDGGPATSADAGAAVAKGADAGTPALEPPPLTIKVSTRGPTPPKPKPGIPLSARAPGKPARTFAVGVTSTTGDTLVVVGTVAAGGAFTARLVDLAAHEKLGALTYTEAADDGTAVAILGGAHVVRAGAGRATAEVVKALEPGQKIGGDEIEAVRDAVVGPGGNGLAIVDVLTGTNGETAQMLVTLPKGAVAATVLRKAGDKIPGASTDATIAKGWTFKKSSGAGSVLLTETYLEGGDDVGTRLSGESWLVNPQRMLAVKLDAPKALTEVARTGTEPSGIDGMETQIFGDAWLMPDGRAVFDANFIERGGDGWLYVAKAGGGLFALAPTLRQTDAAPWTAAPPRAKHLEASGEGTLVFRRDDGAVVFSPIENPGAATAGLLGADALAFDGHKLGTVASVDVPIVARGGEWLIASVQLHGATVHDAVVLASRADVQNGKCEVILEVGGKVGEGKRAREIQSLRFFKGRDELLWTH